MDLPSDTDILAVFQRSAQQQFSMKNLLRHFGVPAYARPAFRRRIRDLVTHGRLMRVRGARFALADARHTLAGVVKRHADGYGFFRADTEGMEDVYIAPTHMYGVCHDDRVLVRCDPPAKRGARRSGRVVQILERLHHEVTGRVETRGKAWTLLPLEARLCPEVYLGVKDRHQAQPGQIAVAAIVQYDLGQAAPRGRITEVLGEADDPHIEFDIILRKYGLAHAFPPEVEAAANAVPMHIGSQALRGRRDLRGLLTFTIDGETARDFDDAVSLEVLPHGHVQLGVHIADVSYYVREGSVLDREAFQRGTSVYFPDRVIPMLPERLSNLVCCLQPEVDRLTRTMFLELSPAGEVVRYESLPSIICSQARLTYTQVTEYLEGNVRALNGWPDAVGDVLQRMDDLAVSLRRRRMHQGSIDFDLPESDILLDHAGNIDAIIRAERNRAHMLIEEFMLLANRTVATHLAGLDVPALYRVHDPPHPDRIAQFTTLAAALGYAVDHTAALSPSAMQAILNAASGTPEEQLINTLLLRSMQRARYASDQAHHFGLAFEYYTHFTSPIRRYADLIVHRLMHDTARAPGMSSTRRAYWTAHLASIAEQTSTRERNADEAEREMVAVKKAEYMRDKLGREYNGVIVGVTRFGLFIELEELLVEGLVHIHWLPDDFLYHAERFCLVGRRTGQVHRLGDRVRVRIANVSVMRRQIDFSLLAKL